MSHYSVMKNLFRQISHKTSFASTFLSCTSTMNVPTSQLNFSSRESLDESRERITIVTFMFLKIYCRATSFHSWRIFHSKAIEENWKFQHALLIILLSLVSRNFTTNWKSFEPISAWMNFYKSKIEWEYINCFGWWSLI